MDSDKKIEQWVVADILNFLPDATLVIDCLGRVIAWNKAAEEMTGIKSEEILGKGDYEYSIPFYGYRRPLLVDHVLNYEQGWEDNYSYIEIKGQTIIGESLCRTKDNPQAYLWKIATPLYDIQGNINGAIESIRDVTDNSSWVPNVVFTCGAIPALEKDILEDDDEILVYYGAADTHIAVATATLAELIPAEYRR